MSKVLFPKWFNIFPTASAIAGLAFAGTAIGGFWYYATPKYWDAGYEPVQPGGGFNHQIHAGKLGMDCRYCHTKVESSAEANIPNVATCYGCHGPSRLAKYADTQHKAKTDFIRAAYDADESIEWRRVHKLPDYVRNFPHNAHISVGVSCYSCHGQITQMPEVYQSKPMSMGWCLECHRNAAPNLVEKDKVTQLKWVEKILAERAEKGGTDGDKLLEKWNLRPPDNCGKCHY